MSSDVPLLSEVLDAAMASALSSARTNLPGEIVSYDAESRTATVQVAVMDGWVDQETGERQAAALKPLTDVPYGHIGSGSVRIKFPVRRGDQCWLSFSSSSLAAWKASAKLVDPGDDRRHHIADVVALPMFFIGGEGSGPLIEFTADGQILAGGGQALATKADVTALANFVQTLFVGGTGSVVIPPGAVPQPTGTITLKGA